MLLAASFFDVVLAIHIMAVVFAFGATLAYPVLLGTISKADSRALPALYKALHAISTRVIMPGLVVILVAGIYMASDHKLWSEFFVQWGLGVVVVIGAVEGMFLSPNEKRLCAIADRDLAASPVPGPSMTEDRQAGGAAFAPSAEHDALVKRIGAVGAAMDGLVLLTILFMVVKP
jgi:hypothetical protein